MQFNGAELVLHSKFKLFIVNNAAQVKLNQDIATRLNIINFTLKPETLEKQLLNMVYKRESENQAKEYAKDEKDLRRMKLKVDEKEQKVLKLLISGIDFLREKIFKSELEDYKELKENYESKLADFDLTKKAFTENRLLNDRIAKLGSKLYYILYELSKVNHMYQFSIMNFMEVFKTEIKLF